MAEDSEILQDENEKVNDEEIKRKNFLNSIQITNAYFISPENTESFVLEYKDEDENMIKEHVRTGVPSDMLNKVLEIYTLDDVMQNTYKRFEAASNFARDLQEFIDSKNQQLYPTKAADKISLLSLTEMTTEDLFKLKLEIFEDEKVQNSENRELRSAIRKSKNAIELIHNYHLIIKDIE